MLQTASRRQRHNISDAMDEYAFNSSSGSLQRRTANMNRPPPGERGEGNRRSQPESSDLSQ
jgi:hypothetical protein